MGNGVTASWGDPGGTGEDRYQLNLCLAQWHLIGAEEKMTIYLAGSGEHSEMTAEMEFEMLVMGCRSWGDRNQLYIPGLDLARQRRSPEGGRGEGKSRGRWRCGLCWGAEMQSGSLSCTTQLFLF